MKQTLAGWLCLLWSVLALAEAPGDFAFGMLLQAEGSQPLLRVELPAAVHAGVRRPDLGDLRVFNAAGEAVPHAWLPQPPAPRARPTLLPLPLFALRGAATAGVEGVEVRIERQGGRAVLRMDERAGVQSEVRLWIRRPVDVWTANSGPTPGWHGRHAAPACAWRFSVSTKRRPA